MTQIICDIIFYFVLIAGLISVIGGIIMGIVMSYEERKKRKKDKDEILEDDE